MRFVQYNIAREIKQGLKEMGYTKPTDIQYKAIPSILKKEDVLAIAQTGTGKTAAFAVPIVHLINNLRQSRRPDGIKCVVLAPTHELVLQITEVFRQISKYTDVQSMSIIGGVDQDPQIAILAGGVDILVATPGRLFDLKSQGYIHLDRVEILVLDEADHMLDLGFIKDIQDLGRSLPRNRQTLFFSATIDEKIKDIAYSLVRNPIRIQISPKNPVAKNIQHSVAYIEMDDKRFFLERMIKENPECKFIAFVRTIVRAERVSAAMARAGIESKTIHRDKRESERMNVMDGFKKGEFKLLIATDISARGIDVPKIDFVVNYDLPNEVEMYVHRVGRTGRGKEKGIAISFVSEEEKPILAEIEEFLSQPIRVVDIYTKDYRATREMAEENKNDWKKLMADAQEEEKNFKKKKKKRGKK